MVNRCLTYSLWLLGGLVGLHHLYLGRRVHAFAWLASLGGFGVGWMLDLFLIGGYVDEANNEVGTVTPKQKSSLSTSHYRFAGEVVFGSYFGGLVSLAIPFQWILLGNIIGGFRWPDLIASVFVGCGVAWGVYIIGNIGHQKRSFVGALSGALPTSMLLYFALGQYGSIFWIAITSAIRANKTVRSSSEQHHWSKLFLWAVVFYALWTVLIFNSIQVQVTDNASGKELYMTLGQAFVRDLRINGNFGRDGIFSSWEKFQQFGYNFLISFTIADNDAFTNAWTTLGIEPGSSQRVIKHHCRELLASHHPDRINSKRNSPLPGSPGDGGGSATKEFDLNKYSAIQSACELLENDRSQRLRKVQDNWDRDKEKADPVTKQEL